MYKEGSVCVCGLVGRGKDMLMANVVVRRGIPYVGNTNYCSELYIPFNYKDIDCGGNTYDDFINGTLKYYEYPYPDGTDIYLGDLGVYFPSQYCSELNHKYKNIPTFLALSRQLGKAHVHFNVQNLNRAWDKVREMSEKYVWCSWCKVFLVNGYCKRLSFMRDINLVLIVFRLILCRFLCLIRTDSSAGE